jgi:hypothetical protein
MATSVRTIEQPSYFRARINAGAADIPRGRILTRTTAVGACVIATAATQVFCGVSAELMEGTTAGAITRDTQVAGKAMVVSGAAYAAGVELTSDAQGRAIAATDGSQCIIGVSETAATAAEQDTEVEIDIRRSLAAIA